MSERIARHLARAGLCSRREAERWIAAGRVSIDGVALTSPARNVGPDSVVRVDGELVGPPPRRRLWRYHKPPDLLTTRADPGGRRTIFEMLPPDLPRVIAVGRLDLASEGLLLLTNDGDLAQRLAHPRHGLLRCYRVRVNGRAEATALAASGRGNRGPWHRLRSDRGGDRTRRRRQQLAQGGIARGQESRDPPGIGAPRAPGKPAHTCELRPVRVGTPGAWSRRRGAGMRGRGRAHPHAQRRGTVDPCV